MHSRTYLLLSLALAVLLVPSTASFRGSRGLDGRRGLQSAAEVQKDDDDDDGDKKKRIGAVVINATDETVTAGTAVNVSFNVLFPENATMPGEEAHYLTVLAVSQKHGKSFLAKCKVDGNGTVAEKCIDDKEDFYFWEAEVKAPSSNATASAGGSRRRARAYYFGIGPNKAYDILGRSGNNKGYYDKDDKENDVKLVPASDGSVAATIHVKKDTEGIALLFLNNGIKNVTVSNLTVSGRTIQPPDGTVITVPAATSAKKPNTTTTVTIGPSGANITTADNSTSVSAGPNSVNVTTGGGNGTTVTVPGLVNVTSPAGGGGGPSNVTAAGPKGVSIPGVVNVTVTNVTYGPPK